MRKKRLKKEFILAPIFVLLAAYIIGGHFGIDPFNSIEAEAAPSAVATVNGEVQEVTTVLGANEYTPITIQSGVLVRWNIKADARTLNGCNNVMQIPEYGIEKQLVEGDNIIEFIPTSSGVIGYSCWMGMIRSQINIVKDLNNIDVAALASQQPQQRPMAAGGGGCCGVQSLNQ